MAIDVTVVPSLLCENYQIIELPGYVFFCVVDACVLTALALPCFVSFTPSVSVFFSYQSVKFPVTPLLYFLAFSDRCNCLLMFDAVNKTSNDMELSSSLQNGNGQLCGKGKLDS